MYGTIADWRAYALARGDDAPTNASDPDAEAALTRASDYIRLRYAPNLLRGATSGYMPPGHALPLVEEGAYIAASYELATPKFFTKTFTASDRKVLTAAEGIEWTPVGGQGGDVHSATPTVTAIEALFDPFITGPNDKKVAVVALGGNR